MRHSCARKVAAWAASGLLWGTLLVVSGRAETFTIDTAGGLIHVSISHVGPSGRLMSPDTPEPPEFRPPTIFSAPLPSGSGARALGLAGAFTAIADDATAASWNPAGLIQLERPEASIMLRASEEKNKHSSASDSFIVGENNFGNENLNYLSFVYPFRLWSRNFVCSINYQEAYDFEQRFTATAREQASSTHKKKDTDTYRDTVKKHIVDGIVDVDVTSRLTTRKTTAISQLLDSDLLSEIDFDQEGIIDAVTPALAIQVTPKLSLGVAVNFYQDSPFPGGEIQSRTRAIYSGDSDSTASLLDRYVTSGTYTYDGVIHWPASGGEPAYDEDISGSGKYPSFSDSSRGRRQQVLETEGLYEEINDFADLRGMNATLGVLWTVSRFLSLGFSVDLPWTAEAKQTKTVRNTVTTYSQGRASVLDVSTSETVERKDVEFEFPLYWALGAVWRWNNRLYSTLDISQTLWSDFSFKAEGEDRINPLDGTPYGENEVDDTWSVRTGIEYLLVLRQTEIPFRAGVAWEQRPAVGDPDEFWSFALGSGVSLGKEPGRVILDFAYVFTIGEDVLGTLVPGQDDMHTDVEEHQFYASCIKHF